MAKTTGASNKQSFPRELLEQSPSARRAYFKAFTVAHPFLQRADTAVWNALREPAGALLVFVIGPTGVGKTTLLTHIQQRLIQQAQARLVQDPDHMPVINLYAMAPSARQFRWPDFYTRALMAVSEPLIDYKVDTQAVIPIFNEKMGRHVPPQLVGDAAMLQRSWEQVLRYRQPGAIFVDEAQHFAKTAGGSRLVDQLDHVKSLAVATQTVHVLAGTYDLLVFRNLSAQLLPIRGLARNRLAWCPACYEEWQASGHILYDPLLWVFREISFCIRHGVRLQMHCPHCTRSLPHLTWRSRPGYCAFCAGPLFGEPVRTQDLIARDTPEFAWQQWVTIMLGAVVAQLPLVCAEPKRERICQVVSHAVEQLADGNIARFAHLLGLPRNTVENWCQGKRIPEMDMLLRLCYRLDLSLCEVMFQEAETLQPRLQGPLPSVRFSPRKRTAIDKERISSLLEQVVGSAEDPPPSLQEVGQRLGYQPTSFYKINRTACHSIAERHTAYRRQLREKRLQGYREEIRQIALLLQAEHVALTRRHIARYLSQPAILRDPHVRAILREICREVESNLKDISK